RELGSIRRHAGQVVVVISGQQRDRHPLAGLAKLAEQRRTHGGDPLQLGWTLAIGQLPESEGVAHDDELGGLWPGGDVREEPGELTLEVAAGESAVASDVQVADEVVGRRHRRCAQGEPRGYPRRWDTQKSARRRRAASVMIY